jgi:hypothetical protein
MDKSLFSNSNHTKTDSATDIIDLHYNLTNSDKSLNQMLPNFILDSVVNQDVSPEKKHLTYDKIRSPNHQCDDLAEDRYHYDENQYKNNNTNETNPYNNPRFFSQEIKNQNYNNNQELYNISNNQRIWSNISNGKYNRFIL